MRAVVALALVAVLTGACGNRIGHREILDAALGQVDRTTGSGPGGSGLADAGTAAAAGGGADAGSASAARNGTGDPAATASSGRRPGAADSSRTAVAGATPGPATGDIKLGTVGTLSGPAGGPLGEQLAGLQAWMRSVNVRGGVKGHLLRLTAADDGADPARHRAKMQQLVEVDRVLALLNDGEVLTGQTSVEYLTGRRVPAIGSDTGGQWFYTSPVYFPQASSGDAVLDVTIAGVAEQAIARGKHKLGVIACTEAQACHALYNRAAKLATDHGLQLVYRAQASLAQPDFTAECLSARNAGAEIIDIASDPNSIGRIAASCARQGYHPIFGFGAGLVSNRQPLDPNLATAVAISNVFPWFVRGTPTTDDYQQAMRTFGVEPSLNSATAWTSGKLFERGAANLTDPPTSEALLRGLWSISGDDLGGLTGPLTFVPEKPAPVIRCWFDIAVSGQRWVSPDGAKRHCE